MKTILLLFVCIIATCYSQETTQKLIKDLSHTDSSIQIKALESLGKMGPMAKLAIPAVVKALVDKNVDVRKNADKALNRITLGNFHRGTVSLYPGETKKNFDSYSRNKILVYIRDTKTIIFGEKILKQKKLVHKDLPFHVEILEYFESCQQVFPAKYPNTGIFHKQNYSLKAIPSEKGENLDGFRIRVKKNSKTLGTGYLFRLNAPTTFKLQNQTYTIEMGRESIDLAFSIKLTKFTLEFDPNTQIFTRCESEVEFIAENAKKMGMIYIREPLQYGEYFLFQRAFVRNPRMSILEVIMLSKPKKSKGINVFIHKKFEEIEPKNSTGQKSYIFKSGSLQLKFPKNWEVKEPSNSMRLVEFALRSHPNCKVVGYYFGTQNYLQAVAANFMRWKGQFKKLEEEKKIPLKITNASLFYFSGTFYKRTLMAQEGELIENYAMLGAIIDHPRGPYYFRLVGPKDILVKEMDNFVSFLNSCKIKE